MRRAEKYGVWNHLARFVFFALVVVELLVVGLSRDGDLRFKLVEVVEAVIPSVFWSCFQFLESAVV